MAYLKRALKDDLLKVCEELDIEMERTTKVSNIKKAILDSESYDEEAVKNILETVIEARNPKAREERLAREEKERKEQTEERIRQEEKEERRRKVEEEKEERKRKEEERKRKEEEEKEERKRKEQEEKEERIRQEEKDERIRREAQQHEVELRKIELLQANPNEKTESSPRIQLTQITPKFDERNDEMGLYLINFERKAELAQVPKKDWVAYLTAVLPSEVSNMLAREPKENANNYDFVKSMILRKYKLNSEKLKQCFYKHQKTQDKTWRNYAQELSSYFTEWIHELKVETFQQLKDLIITEQLKFRVPSEIRNHYLEAWLKFVKPLDLAEKLDEFESIRDSFKNIESPKKNLTDYRNQNGNIRMPIF